MSSVNFLEELIDGVSVEWKALDDVIVSLKTGLNPRQNFELNTADAEAYYVTVREIQDDKIKFFDSTDRINKRALELINNRSNLEAGDILFSSTGTVGRTAVVENKPKNWNIKEGVYVIKPQSDKLHSRYLYHLLNSQEIVKDYRKKIVGAPVISLPMSDFRMLKIPIPCPNNPKKSLEIQSKIVIVLDSFAELIAVLTAELTVRKQQYKHYREQLFSFEEDEAIRLPMGHHKVGEFIRGGGLQKKDFIENGAGCIHYGQIYTHYGTYTDKTKTYVSHECFKKARKAKTGDLVIATTSENDDDVCKAVTWLGKDEIAVSGDACIYRHKLNSKYVSYFFQSEQFQKQKKQHITGAKVRRVNANDLAKLLIPIPSDQEQNRIVTILDKFDTLTYSISEGLPREIKLRRKQYEYYRDLLLSFPKSDKLET